MAIDRNNSDSNRSSSKQPEDLQIPTLRLLRNSDGCGRETFLRNSRIPYGRATNKIINIQIALTADFAKRPSLALGPCRGIWLTRTFTCRSPCLAINAVEVTNPETVWSATRVNITLKRSARSTRLSAKSRIDRW